MGRIRRRRMLLSSAAEESGNETEVLRKLPRAARENASSHLPVLHVEILILETPALFGKREEGG